MVRGAWWAKVHGVKKESDTEQLTLSLQLGKQLIVRQNDKVDAG